MINFVDASPLASYAPKMIKHRWLFCLLFALWFLGPSATNVHGQDDYLEAIGVPPFTTSMPVEKGFINLANGNLHLEIPLASAPQRGGHEFKAAMVYDSDIWSTAYNGYWFPKNVRDANAGWDMLFGGWRLVTSADSGGISGFNVEEEGYCDRDDTLEWEEEKDFVWSSPDGTTHSFPMQITIGNFTACADYRGMTNYNADALATDATGYHMYSTSAGFTIYGPDGVPVGLGTDANGNYYSKSYTSYPNWTYTDNLGRTLITTSQNGNQIYYDILDSTGNTRRFTVNLRSINVHTGFNQGPDYTWPLTIADSITLPDGTAYSFTYDEGTVLGHYGLLSSMTLPTGGTVSYGYQNVTVNGARFNPDVHRMATSYTQGGGTSSLTPQVLTWCAYPSPLVCQQQTTVVRPNGDTTVYTFEVLSGAWPIQVDYYDGSVSSANLLASVSQSFDFSFPCASACGAASYITKSSTTTMLPVPGGSLSQTIQYNWDSGEVVGYPGYDYCCVSRYGQITHIKEWEFYTGSLPSSPDRTTDITYLDNQSYFSKNILNRRTNVTVSDKNGNTISQTLNTYDGSSLAPISGIVHHDDTNYGTGNMIRGNLTQVQKLVSGTSNYITKSMTYDMTGQLRTETDWSNSNTTTYDYTDNFFADNGDGSAPVGYTPPAATNAYLKTITQGSLTTTFGYYWGTGQKALTTDPNNQTTYFHFDDPLNRPTSTRLPNTGWNYSTYSSATQVDTGTGITSSSLSISCSGISGDCRDDRTVLDGLGRQSSKILVSDPDGATYVDTTYDANGRVHNVSNPHRSGSLPTDGGDTFSYDGFNRPLSATHADGSATQKVYGTYVTAAGGIGTQLGSPSIYGYGYPVLSIDETGRSRQNWFDGFGRIIEVDEPTGSTSATPGTGSAIVNGSEQFSTGSGTPGSGWATINGSEQMSYTNPTAGSGSVTIEGAPECGDVWDPWGESYYYDCDSGDAWVTVNGSTASVYVDGRNSDTSSSIAARLADSINSNGGYPVTAWASDNVVYLYSKDTGSQSNYSLSAGSDLEYWPGNLAAYPSGSTLTGGSDPSPIYDSGSVWVTVNGFQASANYGQGSTTNSLASAIANVLNTNGSSPVTASLSGTTLNLTAKSGGAATNYSLSSGSSTSQPGTFSQPSFSVSRSGNNLTGGVNGTTSYDNGIVWLTVNGLQASVTYGQGSTAASVANAIATIFNTNDSSTVTASVSGAAISLTANAAGSGTNYSMSTGSSTNLPGIFSQPSFSLSLSGGALTGGSGTPRGLSSPVATFYTYDANNNLTGVVQGAQTRSFGYDDLSRLIAKTEPETGTTHFYYTTSGAQLCSGDLSSICRRTDARGITTTYAYNDPLNRLTAKSYSDSTPGVSYFYDQGSYNGLSIINGKTRRTGMSDGSGQTAWSYDEIGNVKTEQRTIAGVTKAISYAYNKDSTVASITYPSGRIVSYAPGGAQRPFSAVDVTNSINYATNAHYAPQGGLSALQDGSSLISTLYYNNRLQPCRISVKSTGGIPSNCADVGTNTGNILDFAYDFGGNSNNGNVIGIANNRDTTRSQIFSYDVLNRIASAAASTYATSHPNCWGESFGYDQLGNLLSIGVLSSAYNGCTNTENLGVSANTNNQLVGYCYDAAGNMLGISPSCTTYVYDAESRLISTGGVTYTYDGDGKRVKKSGGRLYFYNLGLDPLAESDLGGNITDEYTFFNGKRIARRIVSSGAVNYYFADHLGSSHVIANASGTILDDEDFYPFGGERGSSSSGNHYKFTGKERDPESGLDDFGARYYSSQYGRFMTPDEFKGGIVDSLTGQDIETNTALPYADITDPQTLNKYGYVRNNPLRYTDPNGHCIWDLCIVEGIGVVETVAAVATAYGLYKAVHELNTAVDSGLKDDASFRKNTGEMIDAAARGDASKAQDKEDARKEDIKNVAKDAQDGIKAGVQIPGTSIAGDLPTSTTDLVVGAITGTVTEKIIDSAGRSQNNPQASQPQNQQRVQPPPRLPCKKDGSGNCS